MEALFNLAWVAVTFALFAMWLAITRTRRKDSLLPPVGVQLIAIAMLAVILLPVISLSDDLQAAPTLAESEHLNRRADCQPTQDQLAQPLPVALAQLVAALPTIPDPVVPPIPAGDGPARTMRGYFRAVAPRPSPGA